jgi:hypothetical protein
MPLKGPWNAWIKASRFPISRHPTSASFASTRQVTRPNNWTIRALKLDSLKFPSTWTSVNLLKFLAKNRLMRSTLVFTYSRKTYPSTQVKNWKTRVIRIVRERVPSVYTSRCPNTMPCSISWLFHVYLAPLLHKKGQQERQLFLSFKKNYPRNWPGTSRSRKWSTAWIRYL